MDTFKKTSRLGTMVELGLVIVLFPIGVVVWVIRTVVRGVEWLGRGIYRAGLWLIDWIGGA